MTTLLLHGLGADRRQPLELFAPAVRAAAGDDELVIAPDVRAHGGYLTVGEPADFAIDRLAAEIATTTRAQVEKTTGRPVDDDGPLTVIGLSMGAAIAMRLLLGGMLPIDRAVFVRPAFDDRSLPDNLRAFPVIGQLLIDAGPAGAQEFRERELYQRVADESPAAAKGLLSQFTSPDAARRAMRLVEIPRNRAFANDAELAALGGRGVSTFVIAAPRDPVHPVPTAEHWAGALGAPLAMLTERDAGQARQNAVLAEHLARWLERAPRT
ncbi:alpha/beta hydrolase [Agromyces sp. H3Y2-19a]|uniref:alpha/beta fold hydrolase n=1 Tax=Agromyces chromiiresistens TaxID=3030835 RepID=UPI0023B93A0D|nr:alpha/beta hydrolase [Agromyces chromiiresistens]MDF0514100.1 alpha/beta hydrolase [Agromyces chromiiresistens]